MYAASKDNARRSRGHLIIPELEELAQRGNASFDPSGLRAE